MAYEEDDIQLIKSANFYLICSHSVTLGVRVHCHWFFNRIPYVKFG
jgi:hypothetical protein